MVEEMKISIIGGGNMGGAIARGLADSNSFRASNITVIERDRERLKEITALNPKINCVFDNYSSLQEADIVVIAVKPWGVEQLFRDIRDQLRSSDQIIVSVAASLSLAQLDRWSGSGRALFCAMPNTAIAVKQSMTFIAQFNTTIEQENRVLSLFRELGRAEMIEERLLPAASSLCSCGIAFAFRYIRAAMEGGVELGFFPETAKEGVIQTLRGAIDLLESNGSHPEAEIDRVTTAGGVTIRGLNEMEHAGFSSAVIRGLKASNQ